MTTNSAPDGSTPLPNTSLLNDYIDIELAGGLTGSDSSGKDKTSLRVRLGDKLTIKTNLLINEDDDDSSARDTLGVTNVATQTTTQYSLLAGDANNSIKSIEQLQSGQVLLGRSGSFPTGSACLTTGQFLIGKTSDLPQAIGPLTNGQLFIGSTGAQPVAASLTSSDSSITITGGAGTINLTGAGKLVQTGRTSSTSGDSTTSNIPLDNTIPQNTEGKEYISLSFTPRSTTNILKISFTCYASSSALTSLTTALFQDSTANALYAHTAINDTNQYRGLSWIYYMSAGTTSATTFKVRFGPNTATTMYINRHPTGQLLGGVERAVLTIEEYSG